MRTEIRDWFGLLELYIIVEKWRPWFRRWNLTQDSLKRGYALWLIDREFWERHISRYGER